MLSRFYDRDWLACADTDEGEERDHLHRLLLNPFSAGCPGACDEETVNHSRGTQGFPVRGIRAKWGGIDSLALFAGTLSVLATLHTLAISWQIHCVQR